MNSIKTKLKLTVACFIIATFGFSTAHAQLGGLKNAAKAIEKSPKGSNSGSSNDSQKNKTDDKESKSKSTSSASKNNYGEKGDEAFKAKNYEEAKVYYEKERDGNTSDYVKSQWQSKVNDCVRLTKNCKESTAKIESMFAEKKFADLLEYYEGTSTSSSDFEKYCIPDDKMKKMVADSRTGAVQQKEAKEKKEAEDKEAAITNAENALYTCSNMKPDNGISGPTHTKYLKKIVFSKSAIPQGRENEAAFTNTFNVTDDIYARVYLEKSILNEARSIGDCFNPHEMIRYTFDDGATKMPSWLGESKESARSGDMNTTWQPGISPAVNDMNEDKNRIKIFVKIIRNLSVGVHKIKMEVVYDIPEDEKAASGFSNDGLRFFTTKFGPEKVLATGEFTVNVTEEGKKALYKKVCPLYKDEVADYNSNAFTVVPNATALIKADKGIDWNKFTLLKVVGDASWNYKKNYYGIVLSRTAEAGAYLLNKEDNLIYLSRVSFYQENISNGGASYSALSTTVEELNIEYTRNYDAFCKECIGK